MSELQNFYEAISNLRKAERKLAECTINLDDIPSQYEDIYTCPGCSRPIIDNAHAYIGPDHTYYHNDNCAEVAQLLKENQS
jgi:hypothetical protein